MMNEFLIKTLDRKLKDIKVLGLVAKNSIEYEYNGMIYYSQIDTEDLDGDLLEYVKAIMKRDIAEVEILSLTKNRYTHIEYIQAAINKKYEQYIREVDAYKDGTGSLIRKIIYKIEDDCRTGLNSAVEFKTCYKECLDRFKICMEEEIKTQIKAEEEKRRKMIKTRGMSGASNQFNNVSKTANQTLREKGAVIGSPIKKRSGLIKWLNNK